LVENLKSFRQMYAGYLTLSDANPSNSYVLKEISS
jgi:hypothetical protein